MSFHNQGFWMGKSTGCLNDGDMTYDISSKMESKRPHQWFMDGPEVDLLPNKKQAVEVPNNSLSTGMFSSNGSSMGNSSSFHSFSGHSTEQLFDPDVTTKTMNYDNRNLPSVSIDKLNVGRQDSMDLYGSDSSFGLSKSHSLEDPRSGFNYGGIRKVKVSEVKESANVMPVSTSHPYKRGVNHPLSNPHAYSKVAHDSISMSPACNKEAENIISVDDGYVRTDDKFMSSGQSYNKGDDIFLVGQTYNESCRTILMNQAFGEECSNMISIPQAYNKADANFMSRGHIYNNREDSTKEYDSARSYNKGESTIISFGACDDYDTMPSSSLLSSYELFMGHQPAKKSDTANGKDLVRRNSDLLQGRVLTPLSGTETVSKTKEESKMSKKVSSNNFPSNVRSLLSTGMLDGVPVKYMAWSQEKELRGVIKSSGYLCSCQSCNYSKVINAYEFERHAGCKTKHPNNHIYFENGKTIYGIVQELRSTPQNLLFEVIRTITGSPINEKSFHIWKESFSAATRELRRIYGQDEVKQLSYS